MSEKQKSNPKAAQVRIESAKASSYSGQRNHDLRKGPQPGYVDASKSGDNEIIIEPPAPGELRKKNLARRSLRDTRRAMRSDAAVAFNGILTFGTEAQIMFEALDIKKQRQAFLDAAEAAAERLNTSLEGLVIHRDESAVHAHFTLAAYDFDGNPLTATIKRQTLKELQDVVAESFKRHAPGIERGRSVAERIEAGATRAETLHKSVRRLHEDLPADIAAKEAELAEASARVDEMRGRVESLEAKAELTDKEAKRLETYKKRLEDRIAVERSAQAEAVRLAQLARDEAEQARRERDEAKTEEEASRIKAARITSAIQVLADEIRDETIGRGEAGNIEAHNPEGLRQGFPDLKPAVIATADAMTAKKRLEDAAQADRDAATKALAEAEVAKRESFNLRSVMKKTLVLLRLTLSRVGRHLSDDERKDAEKVIKDTEALITPPKKPREDSGSDFSM